MRDEMRRGERRGEKSVSEGEGVCVGEWKRAKERSRNERQRKRKRDIQQRFRTFHREERVVGEVIGDLGQVGGPHEAAAGALHDQHRGQERRRRRRR